jgi:hypothetical protein
VRLRVADERLGERGRRVRAHVAEADDLGFITEPPARREREHAARAFALGRVRRGHHVERGGLDLAGHTHIVTDQPSRDDLTIRPCHRGVAAVSRARP